MQNFDLKEIKDMRFDRELVVKLEFDNKDVPRHRKLSKTLCDKVKLNA